VPYRVEAFDIIVSCGRTAHCYADDTQVCISAPVLVAIEVLIRLGQACAAKKLDILECVQCLDLQLALNSLELNVDKTQLM